MNPQALAIRCPSAIPFGRGRLNDWRLIINTDGLPTIVPSPNAILYGVLWELTAEDAAALDFYEDVSGGLYVKQDFFITTPDGRNVSAGVYIAANSTEGCYADREMLEEIFHGAEHFDLPQDYVQYLRGFIMGE
jgi:hypothetical protein